MNKEKQQTAVEWLVDCIMSRGLYTKEMLEEFEQAKEMEKEQIMDAHYAPKYGCFSKDYYNETFKSK